MPISSGGSWETHSRAGEIIAFGGGIYRWAGAPLADDDLVEISERVPMATLCLESALARHGLIDSIPAAIDIALPRGRRSGRQFASGITKAATSPEKPCGAGCAHRGATPRN